MLIYDFPDAYDLFFTPKFRQDCKNFYKNVFSEKKIINALDCSVGSGQMAVPLAELGYSITGTDISSSMIRKARQNFAEQGLTANLSVLDYHNLSSKFANNFDLVLSTGNSLAHSTNIKQVITEMDKALKPGGMLYIDSRNWDLILQRKQRFYLYNPLIRDKGRINYLEVWDYNKDGSMTVNYMYSEEVENKIVSKRQFYAIYHPFTFASLKQILTELGYQNLQIKKLGDANITDLEQIDWYAITAIKTANKVKESKTKKLWNFKK